MIEVGNSAITEANELKYIKFMLKIFLMQIFHIYNPKSKNLIKRKGKICLALVSKKSIQKSIK